MAADTDLHALGAGTPPLAGPDAEASRLDLGLPSRGLSFQSRIAVVALVTAVAVLMAACLLFMLQQYRTERAHLLQNESILAEVAARDIAAALPAGDRNRLGAGLEALKADPRIRSAEFRDSSGRILAQFKRTDPRPVADAAEVKVTAPITSGGLQRGVVDLSIRPEGLGALLPRFLAMGGALFFVAAGLALFMGRWLAARLTRPVDRLSRAMHEVAGSGDFARRVEHGENDEFGRLTESFNGLLSQLQKNDLELRGAMDALVEARDAAEAANVLKSHFLANMSHEIRTPLNGVLAMAQIMAMSDLDQTQRERLAVIHQSGESLLTILNDILDLSKIEAGRMELETAEFDVGELASGIEAAHAPVAARKGLGFSVEVAPSAGGKRMGDRARLQQILNNLVANAIKFTTSGEVRVALRGEGEDGCDGLLISVSDTGIGVPAAKLPLLFQKFSQVDSSTTRQFGGTGLGLAICREIAQLMGGAVWAESAEGVGSTFHVRVPLERTSPAALASAEAAANRAGGDVSELKILAAEDNATNQLVLKTIMATFGLAIDVVADGGLAVEAWNAGQYDLILMDIQMPVMDGIAATRAIRAMERSSGRARTPIIALSANAMTHQVKEYLDAGMDMHVAKPIQLAKLQHALEAAMDGESQATAEDHTAQAQRSGGPTFKQECAG